MDFDVIYSWAKDLPIVDWHNHLDPAVLAADAPFASLYDAWVKTDPYKHRAMRICGEPEVLITGDADPSDKMAAWERTLPKLVGNPLFAWARLERHFLDAHPLETLTPLKLLKAFNVAYISPCVGSQNDLSVFMRCSHDVTIVPSLRMNAGDEIAKARLAAFHAAGCRVVDVSVDDVTVLRDCSSLQSVAGFAASHGWTMLLHIGALRHTSSRLRAAVGPAGGFAGMGASCDPAAVATFLDACESGEGLPRTILLTLNPEAHAVLAVLAGSFVEDDMPGKVQLGPAWWWVDHAEGIRDVLEKQAAYGVLSTFIGMTTDSRSLLSFVRHDYFRRLFCRWLAEKVSAGDFPDNESLLKPLVENACFRNAFSCFWGFDD